MTGEEINNNLNEISNSLIRMHVSDLLNRYNITKENKKLRQLSNSEKSQIKTSVEGLKEQVEAFLANQQNNDNALNDASTQSLVNQLQNLKRK